MKNGGICVLIVLLVASYGVKLDLTAHPVKEEEEEWRLLLKKFGDRRDGGVGVWGYGGFIPRTFSAVGILGRLKRLVFS